MNPQEDHELCTIANVEDDLNVNTSKDDNRTKSD